MTGAQGADADGGLWPKGVRAITLFIEDLDAAKAFYGKVFELPIARGRQLGCLSIR